MPDSTLDPAKKEVTMFPIPPPKFNHERGPYLPLWQQYLMMGVAISTAVFSIGACLVILYG